KRLQSVWGSSGVSQETVVQVLEDWCRSAEETGIEALRSFSAQLRTYALAPSPAT
ncbi:MAG: acyl-CoA desaturase, partial [Gammaproteobacteria bacterium]|nr:acyl-CoA desaturase [Gammaproteobacteria bacterium]